MREKLANLDYKVTICFFLPVSMFETQKRKLTVLCKKKKIYKLYKDEIHVNMNARKKSVYSWNCEQSQNSLIKLIIAKIKVGVVREKNKNISMIF